MLATFVEETLSPEDQVRLRTTGGCETVYQSDRHGAFAVEARADGDKLSLKLRRTATVLLKPTSGIAKPSQTANSLANSQRIPEMISPTIAKPDVAASASRLAHLIAQTMDDTVSDLFVSAGQPLWIRTGLHLETTGDTIDQDELLTFVNTVLDPVRRQHLETSGSVDFAWETLPMDGKGPQRFRANVFKQTQGLALALRPVNRQAPTLSELSLPASLSSLGDLPGGLVLVVGTTGSGKSTTLAALVDLINRTRARHIITLEDPIEFVYQPCRCLIHQREVGTHVESFASGLRAALREAPDVLLVGEMRDRETASMVLTAAETGHLVFSTLHSGSAAMAIDRIVDLFPEHQQSQVLLQLAGSLRAVVNQRLLNGIQPGTRFPALEILTVNYAVSALIRDGKTHQLVSQIQTGRDDGMVSLDASLLELFRAGRITQDTALMNAREPPEMQRRMREAR
jgi:twitching motility protein PilT